MWLHSVCFEIEKSSNSLQVSPYWPMAGSEFLFAEKLKVSLSLKTIAPKLANY